MLFQFHGSGGLRYFYLSPLTDHRHEGHAASDASRYDHIFKNEKRLLVVAMSDCVTIYMQVTLHNRGEPLCDACPVPLAALMSSLSPFAGGPAGL